MHVTARVARILFHSDARKQVSEQVLSVSTLLTCFTDGVDPLPLGRGRRGQTALGNDKLLQRRRRALPIRSPAYPLTNLLYLRACALAFACVRTHIRTCVRALLVNERDTALTVLAFLRIRPRSAQEAAVA